MICSVLTVELTPGGAGGGAEGAEAAVRGGHVGPADVGGAGRDRQQQTRVVVAGRRDHRPLVGGRDLQRDRGREEILLHRQDCERRVMTRVL